MRKAEVTRRKYRPANWQAALLLLLAAYLASYLSLVRRAPDAIKVDDATELAQLKYQAIYSSNIDRNDLLAPLFYPLWVIDRILRPSHWSRTAQIQYDESGEGTISGE